MERVGDDTVIRLVVRQGSRLAGTVTTETLGERAFCGWLELMVTIDAIRAGEVPPERPPPLM